MKGSPKVFYFLIAILSLFTVAILSVKEITIQAIFFTISIILIAGYFLYKIKELETRCSYLSSISNTYAQYLNAICSVAIFFSDEDKIEDCFILDHTAGLYDNIYDTLKHNKIFDEPELKKLQKCLSSELPNYSFIAHSPKLGQVLTWISKTPNNTKAIFIVQTEFLPATLFNDFNQLAGYSSAVQTGSKLYPNAALVKRLNLKLSELYIDESKINNAVELKEITNPVGDINYSLFHESEIYNTNVWPFLQKSSIASVITSKDFNIILFNDMAKRLLHLDNNTEYNFLDLVSEAEKIDLKELALKRAKRLTSKSIEISFSNLEKSAILHLNTIKYDGMECYVITIMETTQYKTLELNFVHSQKMQAVGQLAGAVAHDFNNLLTAMGGFCDLLLNRHPPGDKSFKEIMQIKQNVNRAANLVRQLLAFSRKQVLQPSTIDLSSVIADLSNLLSRLIGSNISLEINHGEGLLYVKADSSQIEQVIVNLAVNARDAMVDGGKIAIKTYNFEVGEDFDESKFTTPPGDHTIDTGTYVVIEISDNGTGVPKEIINQIFEPFFSTKQPGSGTGLGLSTVLGIVNQTGGHIRIKTSNKGTTFYIFLKGYEEPDKDLDNSRDYHAIESAESIALDKENEKELTGFGKILLVEDEAAVRIFTSHALTNKGYDILEAELADEALGIYAREGDNIELIITDVMMPGKTGPEMIDEIQKINPSIKVLFISGYAEDALDHRSKGENFNFLAKPFTMKQLAAKVKEILLK